MKLCHSGLLAICLLCCVLVSGIAQQTDQTTTTADGTIEITATYQQQSLLNILSDIQSKHRIRFFFQKEQLPAEARSFSFQQTPLTAVLDQLFEGTRLSYFQYRDYAIMVLPRDMVSEFYTANYYKALEESLRQDEAVAALERQITIGDISKLGSSGNATVNGVILDSQTKDPIIGATLLITDMGSGTTTDADGNFELTLPTGKHDIVVQYVGYEDYGNTINVYSDGPLNLEIDKEAVNLDEVVVSAQSQDANVSNAQIGVERLDVATIKKLPSFLGEADVVKSLLLNPGVSTIGEGATGFNVRGGEVDQNLVLQDEGFIFNASHALGFFSTFNTDLISGVELYKGNIPAQFGGRLASVLDVQMRTGSFENWGIKGGVGPVSARFNFEGPIVKDKVALIGGFRSSYSDWILNQIKVREVQNSSAFFYDANLRVTTRLNDKNSLTLSGYATSDEFIYNNEFGFEYATMMGQLDFKTIFNEKTYNRFTVTASSYESAQIDLDSLDASRLDTEVSYIKAKEVLTYSTENGLKVDGGLMGIYYMSQPGTIQPNTLESTVVARGLEDEQAFEGAAFANVEWPVTSQFLISAGLRFNYYSFLGPKTVYQYGPDGPDPENLIDSIRFQSGESIASYNTLEPRVSMRYRLNENASIKAGYARTSQFINQIFNSDSPTPTSQFQLSTNYLPPFLSHNFSIGYFQNFKKNNWETSIETYGRVIDQLYDYKDFAQLVVNPQLETEILLGEGRAYGVELSIKKKKGLFNGWLSYTLSRTERMVEGINNGEWYPSNFDKPHDLSFILNYSPNNRHTITMNFSYSTGRPVTPPLGNYKTPNGLIVPVYSERNQFRIPDYHRLDLAYTIGQGYRKDRKFKTSWTFSLYNVYGRRNAFSVFFTQGLLSAVQANKLAILGSVFPSLTFNFQTI